MTTMTFDKLAYVDRLRAAGFNEPQAGAMADGLDQALREEVATKSDVAALGNEIGLLRVEIKGELGTLKSELGDFRREQGEFKSELSGLRREQGEFKSELSDFRREQGELKSELSDFGREQGEFRSELGGLKSELSGLRRGQGDLNSEVSGLRSEQGNLRGELAALKGELLAAMRADKVDILKWVMMLIVGQTAVFTALKLLGR